MRGGHALRPSKACDLDKVIITKCGPFDYAKAETHGMIILIIQKYNPRNLHTCR